jgi:hypothetical protein
MALGLEAVPRYRQLVDLRELTRPGGGQGSMTSLAYTFSPPNKPTAASTAAINKGDIAERAGGEGVPFDVLSNTSVGSVNRSVGAPVAGGESLRSMSVCRRAVAE